MVLVILESKITGKKVEREYTLRQILDKCEEMIVEEMTECNCQPIGETNVIECNCEEEWDDYKIALKHVI